MSFFSIIVPLYNEEAVIKESYRRLTAALGGLEYELLFVNDGSRDRTAVLAREICDSDKRVKLISFSRNFGHQPAITAGMNYAGGDAIIVIDADLQDPPELIPLMIEKWREGYEVVYGKRTRRKGETVFKKITAKAFYRVLNALTDVEIPVDVGDFRLIDRKVCQALKSLPERNRYVRGLVSWVGFKQTFVEYVRDERFAGETKYPLKKMLKFAGDGLTAFSYKPLKISTFLGGILSGVSFLYLLVIICRKLFGDVGITGWASTMAVILFFNGITLVMLGIIGEYIGRIFDETKGRPIYIVGETVGIAEKAEEA